MGNHIKLWLCALILLLCGVPILSQLGRRFITGFMQNADILQTGIQLNLTITAYSGPVLVSISFRDMNWDLVLEEDEMISQQIPQEAEMIGSGKFNSFLVTISSNQDVAVLSLNYKPHSAAATVVYPVDKLGTEYVIITPTESSNNYFNEFAIINYYGPNMVNIYPKGAVTFEGKIYTTGNKLTISLEDSQAVQLQSIDNLSGTRIVSQNPVAVLTGHSCSQTYSGCDHVYEQLLPTPSWGKTFIIPPLDFQVGEGILYITASESTHAVYVAGQHSQNQNLEVGQVLQIEVDSFPIYIFASAGIQVIYFYRGGTKAVDKSSAFLMDIPDTAKFCTSYKVHGLPQFMTSAIFIAKTWASRRIIFDRMFLGKIQWKKVPGTEYSWGWYTFNTESRSHVIRHPTTPFGLLITGISEHNGYGSSGACTKSSAFCRLLGCRKKETCQVVDLHPTCIPESHSECWSWGNLHYHTFDGQNYDFQGTCMYTLAKTCGTDETLPAFSIEAKNENRGSTKFSYISLVNAKIYGYTITIIRSEYGFARINNVRWPLPITLNEGKVQIYQSGFQAVVKTDFSLIILFDWNSFLTLKVSSSFFENICGLCGNYNENSEDDLSLPTGNLDPSPSHFGENWKVDDGDVSCIHNCNGQCQSCSPELTRKYGREDFCGLIIQTRNGPFMLCHFVIDPYVFFNNCVYDMCMNDGYKRILCQVLTIYAAACQRRGIKVYDWRKSTGCSKECPVNSHYKACGNACPDTCAKTSPPSRCEMPCIETCECTPGFVQYAKRCIAVEKCGCVFQGHLYPVNTKFWADEKCKEQCFCNPVTRKVECRATACKPSELCGVRNGIQGCYPTSYSICSASGDPHYITFDGMRYDFQGTCLYQFTELCNNNSKDLVYFQITVQNENRGSTAVSFTQAVKITVFDLEISITRYYPGKVMLNGLFINLPYTIGNDKVMLYKSGWDAIVQVNFGLRITFDWWSHITVTLPSTYSGHTCGLCGNFNGIQNDEFLMKDGRRAQSSTAFGQSWKDQNIFKCSEDEPRSCPDMDIIEHHQRQNNSYCGILLDQNGPFRECHGTVQPEGYFKNCVHDFCYFRGRSDIFCKAIATYTWACQEAGVTLYPWRDLLACEPNCHKNSHYELCARGCGMTCSEFSFSAGCSTRCKEGCVCDKNFLLSGQQCVPVSKCGCTYRGFYYKLGHAFYPNESCKLRCVCKAGGAVSCKASVCGPNEICKELNGVFKCHPTSFVQCTAAGDPHYLTFDGTPFDFQGNCTYTLAKACTRNPNLFPFTVNVKNEKWGDGTVSVTRVVFVTVFEINITLTREDRGVLQVNDVFYNLPYNFQNKLRISQNGINVILTTDFGLEVIYDLMYHTTVSIPTSYRGHMCGLCGNYNEDKTDDFQRPDGRLAPNPILFGSSWVVPITNEYCDHGCGGIGDPCQDCEEEQMTLFQSIKYCGIIIASDGPFNDCYSSVDPNFYSSSCIFDLCFGNGSLTILCQNIQSYAEACQSAGIPIQPWRSPSFCPYTCPENSHFELCGPGCPSTCYGLVSSMDCEVPCEEGCYCDNGFILSGDKCVLSEDCGCVYKDIYYKKWETFYPEDTCQQKCKCGENGVVGCQKFTCGHNKECKVFNGVKGCYPTGYGRCIVSGDPHYLSFDGVTFDFQGTCIYTLAEVSGDDTTLKKFSVLVENENYGIVKSAVTRMVIVSVYGYDVTIERGMKWDVKVNKELYLLPLMLENGKILINQEGNNIVLQTDFGLMVLYDAVYFVLVKVPSIYKGQMSGLCGNYNSDKSDEFTTPSGKTTTSVDEFGKAWKVIIDGFECTDGCDDNCSPCDTWTLALFNTTNYCGIITDTNGPFKECQGQVSPIEYLNYCLYDLCTTNEIEDNLCQNLQGYTIACQTAGATVHQWRTDTFCPLNCPVESHYKLCTHSCDYTCASIRVPLHCTNHCFEGCECNDGLVFDGSACVFLEKCGCVYKGQYIKLNATVLLNKCRESCTCGQGGVVFCEAHHCAEPEVCSVKDGIQGCWSPDPCLDAKCRVKESCRTVDGKAHCVPSYTGICRVWVNPHYHTFDGYDYEFQGTCTYTLSRFCGGDHTLIPFSIDLKNDNSQSVSYIKQVKIYVYGYNITLEKNNVGKVGLNGAFVNLPINVEVDKISIYQRGFDCLVEMDFGLVIIYNWATYLEIHLPSRYYNATCGLCGNFNGNPTDEMGTVTSTPASSILEWASSWRVQQRDLFCCDVPETCPFCDESKAELYESEHYCGLINKENNGAFIMCHAILKPDLFFDSCVYNVCIHDGAMKVFCQELSTYASACRNAGVPVYDWRTPAKCPFPCPRMSYYVACGTACPMTCSDRTATERCKLPCVETCQCNDRYVLSDGKCVPIGNCGCDYGGIHYKPGQEFWSDTNCKIHCTCDPRLAIVICRNTRCKDNERCALVNGVRGCYPITYSSCVSSGDPHYMTFDGLRYNFQGTCIYQLVGICSKDSTLTPFTINVQNSNQGNTAVSFIKLVILEVYSLTLTVSGDYPLQIQINGIFVALPFYFQTNKIRAFISGRNVVIKSDFGLTLIFSQKTMVRVTLPNTYENAICGLCGNYNQKSTDDMTMKNGNPAPDAIQFGDSWKVGEIHICDGDCTGYCPKCSEVQEIYTSEQYCGFLIKAEWPFSQCHAIIDPIPFFNNCVFDVCYYEGHYYALCEALSDYVSACQAKGVQIQEWRTSLFCPYMCPENSHYELCGDGCPVTCSGLMSPMGCKITCTEGCYCDNEYILSGDECVLSKDCGCVYKDIYYKKGEMFYPSDLCQQKCKCGENGVVQCQEFSCGPNEECKVLKGVNGCHPVRYDTCTTFGDSHFLSFDGVSFDFQGNCTYILAKVCGGDPRLVMFSIMIEKESFMQVNAALIRTVTISVSGNIIIMEKGKKWKIKINEELYLLPLMIMKKKIWINQEGNNIVLQTKFGLTVLFDTKYYVQIKVPSTYKGQMCGLCGNYNGDKKDELLLPTGQVTKDVVKFGASWKAGINGIACTDGCGVNCPVCDLSAMVSFQAKDKCGMITNVNGPFKACHSQVSPTDYFNYCLFDMCTKGGSDVSLCQNLQVYTAACQAAGAKVQLWRTSKFCPFSCRSNTQYHICSTTCDSTCSSITDFSHCASDCSESCLCDHGTLYDGDNCVPIKSCGCMYKGQYITLGGSIVAPDCSENCTCLHGGRILCEAMNCTYKKSCLVVQGVRGCYSELGSCTVPSREEIKIVQYSVVGPYELISACNSSLQDWFRVVLYLNFYNSSDLLVVETVYIFFTETYFILTHDEEFRSREKQLALLAKVSDTITVRVVEDTVLAVFEIGSEFEGSQLQVVINQTREVTIKVSRALVSSLCGLCSNFEDVLLDENTLLKGRIRFSIKEMFQEWKKKNLSSWALN
nr:IgGFc-binding protein-like isoform X2 [Geotrypetes seraphini]